MRYVNVKQSFKYLVLIITTILLLGAQCPLPIDLLLPQGPAWSIYDSPTYSPDGSKIAYIWEPSIAAEIRFPLRGRDGLYIMDANGENRELVQPGKYIEYPAFSPDGESILFSKRKLYKIDIDGENLETVYGEGWVRQTSWSPSGDRVVFSADSGETFHASFLLRVMNTIDLSTQNFNWYSELPIGTSIRAWAPEWHPNGITIFFFHKLIGICSIDVDGLNYQVIQERGELRPSAQTISVSPDGLTLTHDMNDQIWIVGINGDNPRVIAEEGERPCWSPDGSNIVYINRDPEHETVRVIWIMDANGLNKHPVTRATDTEE